MMVLWKKVKKKRLVKKKCLKIDFWKPTDKANKKQKKTKKNKDCHTKEERRKNKNKKKE
jgi:hypothetical protein